MPSFSFAVDYILCSTLLIFRILSMCKTIPRVFFSTALFLVKIHDNILETIRIVEIWIVLMISRLVYILETSMANMKKIQTKV